MKPKLFLKPTTVWYAGGLLVGQFWMPHVITAMTENKLGQFLLGLLGFFFFTCVVGVVELFVNIFTEEP